MQPKSCSYLELFYGPVHAAYMWPCMCVYLCPSSLGVFNQIYWLIRLILVVGMLTTWHFNGCSQRQFSKFFTSSLSWLQQRIQKISIRSVVLKLHFHLAQHFRPELQFLKQCSIKNRKESIAVGRYRMHNTRSRSKSYVIYLNINL